jgi:hypothetical protein
MLIAGHPWQSLLVGGVQYQDNAVEVRLKVEFEILASQIGAF